MLLALLAILVGFVLLVWSADRFVDGAAATAKHAGMSSLLIGIVIVGFGASAPEMVVSAIAAMEGNPQLALGNALGSNIVNTGLIIGITAVFVPLMVHSNIIKRELPLLLLIGVISGVLFYDGAITRWESLGLLAGFFILIGWQIYSGITGENDALAADAEQEAAEYDMPLSHGIFWLIAGFVLLIVSSQLLVWGAVIVAEYMGVSDLVIGLTIVALGTSLPELAATMVAAKKGEHDIALGNVVGSNMFNLLAVTGIAGAITPIPQILPEVLTRDWPVMMGLLVALFIMAYGFKGQGRVNRIEGGLLVTAFIAYNIWLITSII